MKMILPKAAQAAAFFMGVCAATVALAASFQVNPVRVQLDAENTSGAITVSNTSTEPVVIQTSIQAWSQADDDDVYAPTSDLLITPPIATIPPGGQQIVRVGLRQRLSPGRELAFRAFIQEVPPAAPLSGSVGLRVVMRIGLPVFVIPKSGARPDLTWSYERQSDGLLKLRVRNQGNAHAQISQIELRETGHTDAYAQESTLHYVLASETRTWTLTPADPRPPDSALKLRAATDAGEIDAEIPDSP